MYPAIPIGTAAGGQIVRTGLPVASLLAVATILVILGLFALRAAAAVRHDAP